MIKDVIKEKERQDEERLMNAIHQNYKNIRMEKKFDEELKNTKNIKKLVLKKWITFVLALINIVCFVIMASDVDSLKVFVITHCIACLIFAFNSMLLIKYGREVNING